MSQITTTAEVLAQQTTDLTQEIAATSQMNFMFGIGLVTAKLMIRANPDTAEVYTTLLDDVAEMLKARAAEGFDSILAEARGVSDDTAVEVFPTLDSNRTTLLDYIDDLRNQYRQELLDATPADNSDA